MAETDYDLVPHEKIRELEQEVEILKKHPVGSSPAGLELTHSVEKLTRKIDELVSLFKDAADQMKLEEKDSEVFSKRLEPMMDKLDALIDQNQKIARGLLAVADMLKDHMKTGSPARPYPIQPSTPAVGSGMQPPSMYPPQIFPPQQFSQQFAQQPFSPPSLPMQRVIPPAPSPPISMRKPMKREIPF